MRLSAIVVACNEEQMLESCLELLGFADEVIVVVDTGSSDDTERIAKRHTKHMFRRKLDNFAAQKNFAISKASGDWILIVDADERVTPALAKEIRAAIAGSECDAYRIGFRNFFLGKELKHGDWQHERNVRLIKRRFAKYSGHIHETFPNNITVGDLHHRIWHFSHRTVESSLDKTVRYGRVQSAEMFAAGHPRVTTKGLIGVIVREFWRRMIRHRGYKDGMEGIIEALYQPFSLFTVYVQLWQLQRRPSIEESYRKLDQEARKHS